MAEAFEVFSNSFFGGARGVEGVVGVAGVLEVARRQKLRSRADERVEEEARGVKR